MNNPNEKKLTEEEQEEMNETNNPQAAGEVTPDHSLPQTEEDPVALLETELADTKDRLIRLYSEFENYKRRLLKERIEHAKYEGEEIFKIILPVIDDFERAIKSFETTDDIKAVKEGVNLIYSKLKKNLEQKGLKQMNSLKEPFNSDLHDAITNLPVDDASMKGKVVDEIEKGYYYNDKVIRHAKVVVGQ
jgi:molecular chaperone GrpE